MKVRNPRRYNVAGLANWGIVEGVVYEDWEEKRFELPKFDDDHVFVAGLDFGYTNDPTALFIGVLDKKLKVLYVCDELYEKNLSNKDIYDRIVEMGYAKAHITADSAEPKSIRELAGMGLHIQGAKKGKDSVLHGIQWIQDLHMVIHPRCVNFLTEISNYSWEEDKFGKKINVPIDDFNHCLSGDTLIHTIDGMKSIKEMVGSEGYLYCYDEATGNPAIGYFHDVRMTQERAETYTIELTDGSRITATSEHPILTRDGWKKVSELSENDDVIIINHD